MSDSLESQSQQIMLGIAENTSDSLIFVYKELFNSQNDHIKFLRNKYKQERDEIFDIIFENTFGFSVKIYNDIISSFKYENYFYRNINEPYDPTIISEINVEIKFESIIFINFDFTCISSTYYNIFKCDQKYYDYDIIFDKKMDISRHIQSSIGNKDRLLIIKLTDNVIGIILKKECVGIMTNEVFNDFKNKWDKLFERKN
jgi:hypothetical protein